MGKCDLDGCNDRSVMLVGDCKWCKHHFCSRHRIPENHSCSGMQSCRQEAVNRVAERVLSERCAPTKI